MLVCMILHCRVDAYGNPVEEPEEDKQSKRVRNLDNGALVHRYNMARVIAGVIVIKGQSIGKGMHAAH